MPRGGHGRVGPVAASAEERKLRGARTRANHRRIEHGQSVAADIERELENAGVSAPGDDATTSSSAGDDTPGPPLIGTGCEPPDDLSESEIKFWKYYAPKLKAQKRLTLLARDVLSGYCSALAMVVDIRADLASKDVSRKDKSVARRELRQYLAIKRMYENDLLLNPATAARGRPFDDPPPLPAAGDRDDFDDEYDDTGASTN